VRAVADARGRSADADGQSRSRPTGWNRPTWPRIAGIAALLVLAFIFSRSCQQSQTRVTQEQAIAIAERQIDFEPEQTQVRLLRQGLSSRPFWFVVFSIPKDEGSPQGVAQYRIDANTGEVAEIDQGGRTQQEEQRQR
jgi:hypothetical protein